MDAVRALVLCVFLLGCASEGIELRRWTVAVEGTTIAVEVPGHFAMELPWRELEYTMHATVELPPEYTERELTLVVPCFHRPLALRVDGAPVPDLSRDNDERRFAIAAARIADTQRS